MTFTQLGHGIVRAWQLRGHVYLNPLLHDKLLRPFNLVTHLHVRLESRFVTERRRALAARKLVFVVRRDRRSDRYVVVLRH